ncbi:hypothetical protein FQR65_LT18669 [Abscondita terminalis]|nr:hypothetical protein FQR65_LT18669 [Abscondita terminalis]
MGGEHDPNEIWSSQILFAAEIIAKPEYSGIGSCCNRSKLKWILDNVEGAREKAEAGDLCFGTVDTWLIWKLNKRLKCLSRSFQCQQNHDVHIRTWVDDDLLKLFNIPRAILPEVKQSSEVYGETSTTLFSTKIPIAGIAGDQQAALFGQMCTKPGMVKNTYGTGCFLLMNTGNEAVYSKNNLLTTVAWKINGEVSYALEGSVFVGGAAIQWLRDGLKIIHDSSEVSTLAETVEDNGGVYFVPALTGLGAPYWDQYARGTIIGVTRGTTDGHIARATLEGIAFQVYDIVKAMEADAETQSTELRVDGGASASNLLMQIQSDLFGFKIIRPKTLETTALGAAYLAGLAVGFWESIDEIQSQWIIEKEFTPKEDKTKIDNMVGFWPQACKTFPSLDRRLISNRKSIVGVSAQNSDSLKTEEKAGRLDFTANIQNNHLWRGLIITDKPVVMGNLSYALDKNKNWKIGIWGASALANDSDGTHYKEINYYVQYSNKNFYIGLWDLYNSRNINTAVAADDIFSYSRRRSAHIID